MRKALIFLFVFVGIAGFSQEYVTPEYKYLNDEVKALWEEWENEREEAKAVALIFLHSLPLEVILEEPEELDIFLGLLIDDVSVFNDYLLYENEILSLDIVKRKMYETVSQLPLTDEEKLNALKKISFMKEII